jgi:hypothetical protein
MSSDPQRLLHASNADPLERELLASVHRVSAPEGAKDLAWRNIAGQIAVMAAIGTVSSSTAAASKASAGTLFSWAFSTKIALLAVGGLAFGGGYWALRSPEPVPRAPVDAVVAPARPPASASSRAPQEVVAPAHEEPPVEDAPSHKLEPRPLDALKAESALLTEARAQLRSGNLAAAQASLDRLQIQVPRGMLMQEREVLGIEVLHARGNVEAAKRRAKAFIKAYPKSPHSSKLSRFLD